MDSERGEMEDGYRRAAKNGKIETEMKDCKFALMKSVLLVLALVCIGGQSGGAAESGQLTALQRLEPERLKAAHEDRLRFARERQAVPDFGVYEDFRAVLHVHAEDSDHTKGTREEVLAAAKKTGVRVVMFSDHRGPKPETWHGMRDGVLFFAGSEESDEGALRYPNSDAARKALPKGELRFLSHVEERYDASIKGFAGMEICNRHTDAKLDRSVEKFLASAAEDPDSWRKAVESFKAYPDEMFAAGTDYRTEIFKFWDRATRERAFTGIGANDAHQNQVFRGVTFDPYEVSFRNLSTHILARELTEPEIREALHDGHAYVSHDWLCDPTGFAFAARNNWGVFPMGDPVTMWGTTRLYAFTPLSAKLKLIHNGSLIHETNGTNLIFETKQPGTYRLEAWLRVAGEERPWIYSNPLYLEKPSLTSLPVPSADLAAPVEVKKNLVYADGKPEQANKHKLDLYVPKEKKSAPVFIFFHGGAWKTGDRSQYPALGYRFAKEGILTVVPSYRLAPKNPYPAQIDDAAAAFAWVVGHIAEYGGDTNRIYVGGHSAGGHLAALLALDGARLKAYGLSPKNIRGVITLSGVFDLSAAEGQTAVFGGGEAARRAASPLFFITPSAPPFLITYCQWDYVPLGLQARQFYAALRKAGVSARLYFTPHESHISEVIALTHDDDATAQALLRFIR